MLGRPFSFVQQRGDGHLVFLQKLLGAFVQDQIAVRPNLSVSVGLRYDWQNHFIDNNNVSPRASFAYAPGQNRGTVIRGGGGVFYERAGEGAIADLLHSSQGRLFRYVVVDPTTTSSATSARRSSGNPSAPSRHGVSSCRFGRGSETASKADKLASFAWTSALEDVYDSFFFFTARLRAALAGAGSLVA